MELKEIIVKHENSVRVSNIARQYNMAKSTIYTILRNKEPTKVADVAKRSDCDKETKTKCDKLEKLLLA